MLQAIRERAQGWIAWVIVILISIPFALWGIQSYLGGGTEPIVASVNGEDITERELNRRFQDFRNELRERLGGAYRPELFDDAKLRQETLEEMIRNNLILHASVDMGLRAGDEQVRATILAVPAFRRDGKFDKEAYERALSYQGLSPDQFERRVRGTLMTSQLVQVVGSSEITTDKELRDAVRLRRQQRRISFFNVPQQRFQSQDPIGDVEVEAYYQAHQDVFRSPEQVKLEYLVLDQKGIGSAIEPDAEALQQLYQSRLDSYRSAEQRRARHILITLATDEDQAREAEVRDKIAAIRERVAAGEEFAALAKELSEDPGSSGQGGDLGLFERGVMDPAFENAAFALELGELSEPVRSAFGYHLIEVTEIQAESVKPLEEVREELVAALVSDEAEHRYFGLAERMGNLAYESPDSLIPAAETLDLKVQTSDWVGRSGGEGVLSQPKVVGAAFSDDVLGQGNNSEVIEIEDKGRQQAVVVRVIEHQEAAIKPLDEVRDEIVRIIRIQHAREATGQEARELADRLRGGVTMQQAAEGYDLVEPGMVDRNATDVPAKILNEAFILPLPGAGASSFGVTELRDGSAAVVAVTEAQEGSLDDLDDQQKEMERQALARTLARTYYDRLQDDLRRRADVQIVKQKSE